MSNYNLSSTFYLNSKYQSNLEQKTLRRSLCQDIFLNVLLLRARRPKRLLFYKMYFIYFKEIWQEYIQEYISQKKKVPR